MIHLLMLRIGQSSLGTFSVLRVGEVPFALTLEPPWSNNTVNLSCIPAGTYRCRRVQSPRFGETFEMTDVPGRDHVLFHKGNDVVDTHGCVLVGEEFGGTLAHPQLLSSAKGYTELMGLLTGQQEFMLTILDPPTIPGLTETTHV